MSAFKSKLSKIINWLGIILVVSVVVTCNLSNHVDAFKCDIVHGSDHGMGWSNSKAEAIKRSTYVCDVIMTHKSKNNDKAYYLKPLRGWVESSWHSGFWFLTTYKDTGINLRYRIMIDDSGDKRHWLARNEDPPKNGDEYLSYNTTYPPDQFEAYLDKWPSSDTIYYNVLRKDTVDFRPQNIEGRLRIVLLRH